MKKARAVTCARCRRHGPSHCECWIVPGVCILCLSDVLLSGVDVNLKLFDVPGTWSAVPLVLATAGAMAQSGVTIARDGM